MADAGIDDILVGYPIVGEREARTARRPRGARRDLHHRRLGRRRRRDLAYGARARAHDPRPVELDTGMRRLGVLPGPPARGLRRAGRGARPGSSSQASSPTRATCTRRAATTAERERLTRESCQAAVETAEEIRNRGLPAPVVSVGSAGTFRFAIRCPGRHRGAAGTYVFNDRSQIAQGAAAAGRPRGVRGRHRRQPAGARPRGRRRRLEGADVRPDARSRPAGLLRRGLGHDDWDVVRLSEEHGVLEVPPDAEVRSATASRSSRTTSARRSTSRAQ